MSYSFAPGVSACLADGHVVILNRRLDRYLMLPRALEDSLRRLLHGEPDTSSDRALRERLCHHGLVLSADAGSRPVLCCQPCPAASLLDTDRPPPRHRDVAVAGARVLSSMVRLRVLGLDNAIRHAAKVVPNRPGDSSEAGRTAAAFFELRVSLRPLDRCLPLSHALAVAAKRADADVRLVLGVKCDPFGAHAWVQLGETVLNDHVDAVQPFTPILAV